VKAAAGAPCQWEGHEHQRRNLRISRTSERVLFESTTFGPKASDTGFRAFSACVICVVPLWVMNTTLSFIVPLLARCGTVTPSCSMVLLGPFGSSFGTLTCVRLSLLSRMHSSLVLPYAGYGDLAAATCVAAPPPPFPLPLPLFVCSFLFFTFVWPPRVVRSSSFGFCVFSGHLIMPSWLDRCNFFCVTRMEGKRPAQCSGTRTPLFQAMSHTRRAASWRPTAAAMMKLTLRITKYPSTSS
jgi:hypothetical protein